jgi:hypothetical protein
VSRKPRKPQRPRKEHKAGAPALDKFFGFGGVVLAVGLVVTLVLFVVSVVQCRQFRQEFAAAADRELGGGEAIEVAAVVSARQAAQDVVERHGLPAGKFNTWVERVKRPGGEEAHRLVFELNLASCYTKHERTARPFDEQSLEALDRGGLREHRHGR